MEHLDIRECGLDCICDPTVEGIILDGADQSRCSKRDWDLALGDF
jgi:hypothetical protein